jgi:hypothetical protein
LVVVGVRPNTIITLDLPVTVVLVAVVLVVEIQTILMAVKGVRVHLVKVSTVLDRVMIGTPVVVGVLVKRVTVGMVRLMVIQQ